MLPLASTSILVVSIVRDAARDLRPHIFPALTLPLLSSARGELGGLAHMVRRGPVHDRVDTHLGGVLS